MQPPRLPVRLAAIISVVAALAGLSLWSPSPASAADTNYPNRARAMLGGSYASGNAITGVTSKLLVPSTWRTPIYNVASDIFMLSGSVFIQFGVLIGPEYIGTKVLNSSGQCVDGPGGRTNFTTPHLFLGAQGPGQPCETLRDLGAFGSTGNLRQFGLRRNSNGTYYATLDNVVKYTTSITFPAAMEPGVVAEANGTCGYIITDAWDPNNVDARSLAWHDASGGWQYWTTQYNSSELNSPSRWTIYRPGGTSASYHADGANPSPAGC